MTRSRSNSGVDGRPRLDGVSRFKCRKEILNLLPFRFYSVDGKRSRRSLVYAKASALVPAHGARALPTATKESRHAQRQPEIKKPGSCRTQAFYLSSHCFGSYVSKYMTDVACVKPCARGFLCLSICDSLSFPGVAFQEFENADRRRTG